MTSVLLEGLDKIAGASRQCITLTLTYEYSLNIYLTSAYPRVSPASCQSALCSGAMRSLRLVGLAVFCALFWRISVAYAFLGATIDSLFLHINNVYVLSSFMDNVAGL